MVRLLNDEVYRLLCEVLAMSPREICRLSDMLHGAPAVDEGQRVTDDEGQRVSYEDDAELTITAGELGAELSMETEERLQQLAQFEVLGVAVPARSWAARRCPICGGEGIRARPHLRLFDATCSVCGWSYSTRRHPSELRQLRQLCRRVRFELWRHRGGGRRQKGAVHG
jgi:hypothetical protein